MPSLTTVTLDKIWAFKCKKTVHVNSSSSSSLSFLDITPALESVLNAPMIDGISPPLPSPPELPLPFPEPPVPLPELPIPPPPYEY